jgi:DNA-binding response OmpR family regulator
LDKFGYKQHYIYLDKDCYLDVSQEVLVKRGLRIHFSRIQFRILERLAQDICRPVSSEEIIAYAWGPHSLVSKDELYVYINRIRNRLEDNPKKPKYLLSVRGYGYILFQRVKDTDLLKKH